MNRKAWIITSILLIWIVLSGWWYMCSIKQVCPENLLWGHEQGSTNSRDTSNKPLTFFWDSSNPIVQESFNPMIDNLFDQFGLNDTMVVIGVYFNGESGVNLGYERAKSILGHLSHYVDRDRVKIESFPESFVTPSQDSSFEAVRFKVIKGQNLAREENLQVNQDILNLTIWFKERSVHKILTPEIEIAVGRLVDSIILRKKYRIDVVGYTGTSGSKEENYKLGRKRAWSIKKMLWDKGLDPDMIVTSSEGSKKLLDPSDPAQNQRVEIIAVPKD